MNDHLETTLASRTCAIVFQPCGKSWVCRGGLRGDAKRALRLR